MQKLSRTSTCLRHFRGVRLFLALAGSMILPGTVSSVWAQPADLDLVADPGEIHSLSRWVIPQQIRGWVGVQGGERDRPMTVTPGNRFLKILGAHASWYMSSRRSVGMTPNQVRKVQVLLAKTRDRLIRLDGEDLELVQRFEAGAVAPRVNVASLGQLNEKIGSVEGEEAQVFVQDLARFQNLLLPVQRREGQEASRRVLPDMSVDLSGAIFLTDRILSIRWNRLENAMEAKDKKPGEQYARAFRDGRSALWSRGIRMTVGEKKATDLLTRPWVDLTRLSALEKKNGPVEAKFWEGFIDTLGKLNPPAGS